MVEATEAALGFAQGRGRDDLVGDLMLRFALTRAIEIIGEAAAKVSAEARAEAPRIPWTAIVGMRNRLIHAYFDVDIEDASRYFRQQIENVLVHLLEAQRLVCVCELASVHVICFANRLHCPQHEQRLTACCGSRHRADR